MNKKDDKKFKEITESRRYCKCSHAIVFKKQTKHLICTYCGHMVFNTKKDEFDYRIREALIKNKKNQ